MSRRIITLTVNDRQYTVAARSSDLLLDVLREDFHLTGTKRGCDMGTCGCCTVLVDGEARFSCLTLAHEVVGKTVTTIEGLRRGDELHPLQRAFAEEGGSQCGFCTPGFIMTATGMLAKNPHPTRDEVKEGLSGNLCRCTGYVKILDAVARGADELADWQAAEATH